MFKKNILFWVPSEQYGLFTAELVSIGTNDILDREFYFGELTLHVEYLAEYLMSTC